MLDHPLYITDNAEGGYDIKTDYDREKETIYAGVESEYGMVRYMFTVSDEICIYQRFY